MIKAVIYDLDDLMVNSAKPHYKAFDYVLKKRGYTYRDLPTKMRAKFVGRRIIDILKEINEFWKLDEELESFYKRRTKLFLKAVKEGVIPMLGLKRSLKLFKKNGLKIAVASSGTKDYVREVLRQFKIKHYFDAVITGDDVKIGKPNPQTYLLTVKKLGLKASECVVLEDATNGIIAAKKAGCKCIAVKNPYTPKQDLSKADKRVKSLNEISMKMINKLK
ncbi:MAG TPA: HAD family phosphatase [Candidatus Nanoarchaeia archaeon]|nr:HAD family phosphatase [Candidatus Nanoarchaeia archaeon]